METQELKNIVEAVLLSAEKPLTIEKIQAIFEGQNPPTKEHLKGIIASLQKEYQVKALEVIEVASGFHIQTKARYSIWISRLQVEKPVKYSRALLETLAIIAYKQPVTRADIETLRGVSVNSQIIKNLMEREWIQVAGYKDLPGKPAVFTTTKEFLDYFNLLSLNELPSLPEMAEKLIDV